MALGFMAAMREGGLRAGTDYSIIGVDDMPDAKFYDPPLTSMFLDFTRLGSVAFDMINRRIYAGERLDQVRLPPVLVTRASTAPPGRHSRA